MVKNHFISLCSLMKSRRNSYNFFFRENGSGYQKSIKWYPFTSSNLKVQADSHRIFHCIGLDQKYSLLSTKSMHTTWTHSLLKNQLDRPKSTEIDRSWPRRGASLEKANKNSQSNSPAYQPARNPPWRKQWNNGLVGANRLLLLNLNTRTLL